MSGAIRAEYRAELSAWLDETTRGLCAEARGLVRKKISALYEEAVQAQVAADDEDLDVSEVESRAHTAFMKQLGTADEGSKRWRDAFLSEKQEAFIRRLGLLWLARRPRLAFWSGYVCFVAASLYWEDGFNPALVSCCIAASSYACVASGYPHKMATRIVAIWSLSLVAFLLLTYVSQGPLSPHIVTYYLGTLLVGYLPWLARLIASSWRALRGKGKWPDPSLSDPLHAITDNAAKITRATRFGPRRAELYRWAQAAGYDLPQAVKDRILTEIEAHYADAVDDLRDEGNTRAQAHVKAMEDLGDPKEAARGYAGYCFGECGVRQLERILAKPPRCQRPAAWGVLLGMYGALSFLHVAGYRYPPLPRVNFWMGAQALLVALTLWVYFFCYEAEHWAFFKQYVRSGLNRILFVRPVGWVTLWVLLRIAWGNDPMEYAALATVVVGQGVKMLTVYLPLRKQIDHPRERQEPRPS